MLEAFDRRLQAEYGFETVITSEEVNLLINQAREFLAHAEDLLQL